MPEMIEYIDQSVEECKRYPNMGNILSIYVSGSDDGYETSDFSDYKDVNGHNMRTDVAVSKQVGNLAMAIGGVGKTNETTETPYQELKSAHYDDPWEFAWYHVNSPVRETDFSVTIASKVYTMN